MTDYFALLDESRRPWMDPASLKTKFLALTAEVHPDRVHTASEAEKQAANQRYAELNSAYNCLREPKGRLRHLLELERGSKPESVQKISPATMDCSLEVSRLCHEGLCHEADAFLAGRAKAISPMLKVQLFEEAVELTEKLNAQLQELNVKRDRLVDELKNLNLAWESAPPVGSPARVNALPCSRLEHIYRDFSYLARWAEQVRERIAQLSF